MLNRNAASTFGSRPRPMRHHQLRLLRPLVPMRQVYQFPTTYSRPGGIIRQREDTMIGVGVVCLSSAELNQLALDHVHGTRYSPYDRG